MKKTILLYLLLSGFSFAFAQQNDPENWRYFISMEQVKCHAETDDMVWLGTEHGLVRIQKDNNERTTWTVKNSNIPSDNIEAIQIDADGNTWIGTYDYILMRQDGNDWIEEIVPFDESLTSGTYTPRLYDFDIAADGSFWLGTNNGLWHLENGIWEVYNSLSGNMPVGPSLDKFWQVEILNDKIYFSQDELFEKNDTGFVNLTNLHPELNFAIGHGYLSSANNKLLICDRRSFVATLENNDLQINTSVGNLFPLGSTFHISNNNAGDISIVLHNGEKYQLQNNQWIPQTSLLSTVLNNNTLANKYYFIDNDGQDWVTDKTQLHRIVNNNLQSFNISDNPLTSNSRREITSLSDGSVYMLDENDLLRYQVQNGWSTIAIPDSVDGQAVGLYGNIVSDELDRLWFNTGLGLLRYDGNVWNHFTTDNSDFPFTSGAGLMATGPDGMICLASWSLGIAFFDGQNWSTILPSPNGLLDGFSKNIGIAPNGDLWILRNQSVQHFDGTNWTTFDQQNSIIPPDIGTGKMVFTNNGDLWMSVGSPGFLRYSGNEWTRFGGAVGTPIINIPTGFDISIGPNQEIWGGTAYKVVNFENDQWAAMDQNNSLILDRRVETIHTTKNGSVWMVSDVEGIHVYNPTGFDFQTTLHEIESEDLVVYPNPTSHFITVSAPFGKRYEIVQSNGILVSTGVLQNEQIDVERLASGLYFIRLFSDKEFSIGKFVKR